MTSFESLIADFSKMTGLGLELDERAGCVLETDGIFITLQYRAEHDDGETAAGGDGSGMPGENVSQFLPV